MFKCLVVTKFFLKKKMTALYKIVLDLVQDCTVYPVYDCSGNEDFKGSIRV